MDTIEDQGGVAEENSVLTRRATVLAAVKMAMRSVSHFFWAGAVQLARAVWAGMLRLSQGVRAGALWSLTRAAALFDTLGPRLYFAMTAHGSITYRIEFTSPDHFEWIRSALQSAGWQVDQTEWSGKSTIIAYKTGPHTLTSGYADRAIKSVTLTLSSIPNKVKTIHPEFIHPDIEPHPRWALDEYSRYWGPSVVCLGAGGQSAQ
ncbi:hypothetical protein [Arthrobacter sp. Y81]|uniref:hypothetical protein n=1 Tax=Arthrobacter sp. Y81 TaxID=2058897 RepID=UPI000CE3B262|nr:hypothetical protein [Arthrobacter sp. Y81]